MFEDSELITMPCWHYLASYPLLRSDTEFASVSFPCKLQDEGNASAVPKIQKCTVKTLTGGYDFSLFACLFSLSTTASGDKTIQQLSWSCVATDAGAGSEWESIRTGTFCSQAASLVDRSGRLHAKWCSLGDAHKVQLTLCVGCLQQTSNPFFI